jgi:transposase
LRHTAAYDWRRIHSATPQRNALTCRDGCAFLSGEGSATKLGRPRTVSDHRLSLADWVKALGTGSTTAPTSSPRTPAGRPDTAAEKVARLEAEIAQLRADKAKVETEKAILRQAAKYFAGETNW